MFNGVPPVNTPAACDIVPAVPLYITPSVAMPKSRVPVAVMPLAVSGVARTANIDGVPAPAATALTVKL